MSKYYFYDTEGVKSGTDLRFTLFESRFLKLDIIIQLKYLHNKQQYKEIMKELYLCFLSPFVFRNIK